jgi:hypothetical protein
MKTCIQTVVWRLRRNGRLRNPPLGHPFGSGAGVLELRGNPVKASPLGEDLEAVGRLAIAPVVDEYDPDARVDVDDPKGDSRRRLDGITRIEENDVRRVALHPVEYTRDARNGVDVEPAAREQEVCNPNESRVSGCQKNSDRTQPANFAHRRLHGGERGSGEHIALASVRSPDQRPVAADLSTRNALSRSARRTAAAR